MNNASITSKTGQAAQGNGQRIVRYGGLGELLRRTHGEQTAAQMTAHDQHHHDME